MRSPVNRMSELVGKLMYLGRDFNKDDPKDTLFIESIICASIRSIASYLLQPDNILYVAYEDASYAIINKGYENFQIVPCDTVGPNVDFLELFRRILVIYGINNISIEEDLQYVITRVVNAMYNVKYYTFQDSVCIDSNKDIDDIKMHLYRYDERLKYMGIPRDCVDFKNIIYLFYHYTKLCLDNNFILDLGLSKISKLYTSYVYRAFFDAIEGYLIEHLKEHKTNTQYIYIRYLDNIVTNKYFRISIEKKRQSKGKLHKYYVKIEYIDYFDDENVTNLIDEEFLKYFKKICNSKYNFDINVDYLGLTSEIVVGSVYNSLKDIDICYRQKFIVTNTPIFEAQLYLDPRFNPIIYIY